MKTAMACLVALLLAACGGGSKGASGNTISGQFVLTDSGGWVRSPGTEEGCQGRDGFDDIAEGTGVQVTDESGKIIGVGQLGVGSITGSPQSPTLQDCQFGYHVSGLPDRDFYSVEVAHRGKLTKSKAELEASGWTLDLEIGG